MKHLLVILTVLGCGLTVSRAQDPSPSVPLGHTVYSALDRFEAKGWLAQTLPGIRPYTRRFVAKQLASLSRLDATEAGMRRTDRGLLSRFESEFAQELRRLGVCREDEPMPAWQRPLRGEDLVSWDSADTFGALNALFRQRGTAVRGGAVPAETVSHTFAGGTVRGEYRGRFGFRLRHFEAREWSTRVRRTRDDVMAHPVEKVQVKGKTIDFREAAFQLVLATDWFELDVGKGRAEWGPGRGSNLLLSGGTTPYAFARLRSAFRRVRYVHTMGFLEPRPGVIDSTRTRVDNGHLRTFPRRKHLAAHRVEVMLPRGVLLGLQESVIYGDRRPELLYATPVTVLAAAQSYLGDTDNLMTGLDIAARPLPGLKAYLAFLFDDMVKFSPGDFANKFGLQLGILWADPVGWSDTGLRLEYTRIEPFVYSHNFDINTYEHFDALLGSPIGPNADRVWCRLGHRFTPSWSAAVEFERERQGENPVGGDGTIVNVGGDATLGRRPDDARSRDFLAGEVEKRTRLGAQIRFEPAVNIQLQTGYQRLWAGNALLPSGRRGDTGSHFWSMDLGYNFR